MPANKINLVSGLAAIRERVNHHGVAVSAAEMDAAVLREAALRDKALARSARTNRGAKRQAHLASEVLCDFSHPDSHCAPESAPR